MSFYDKIKQIFSTPTGKKLANTGAMAAEFANPMSVFTNPTPVDVAMAGMMGPKEQEKPEQLDLPNVDLTPTPDSFGTSPTLPPADKPEPATPKESELTPLNLNLSGATDDEAVQKAQRKAQLWGLLPQALAGAGDMVMAGGAPYGAKGKTDSIQDVTKIVNQNVADIKTQADAAKKNDPNSDLSKEYQALAGKAFELMGKKVAPQDLAKMSAAQLEAVMPNLEKVAKMQSDYDTKMATQEMLRQSKETQKTARLDDKMMAVAMKMRSDPMIKELEKQGVGFDAADTLISAARQGNTMAFAALGTKMARAMGEVGVLTDKDVTRYVTSPMLARKIADKANILFSGRPTETTQQELAIIAKVMEQKFKTRIASVANHYSNLAVANYGVSPAEAYRRLNAQFYQPPSSAPAAPSGAAPKSNDPLGVL